MRKSLISKRSFCVLSGLSGIVGVVLILLSFNINPGSRQGTTGPELVKFGEQHGRSHDLNQGSVAEPDWRGVRGGVFGPSRRVLARPLPKSPER